MYTLICPFSGNQVSPHSSTHLYPSRPFSYSFSSLSVGNVRQLPSWSSDTSEIASSLAVHPHDQRPSASPLSSLLLSSRHFLFFLLFLLSFISINVLFQRVLCEIAENCNANFTNINFKLRYV